MTTKPVPFKERSLRRLIRAAQKEDLRISHVEMRPDGTISVTTAPRPKLDLTDEVENLGLPEVLTQSEAAA